MASPEGDGEGELTNVSSELISFLHLFTRSLSCCQTCAVSFLHSPDCESTPELVRDPTPFALMT